MVWLITIAALIFSFFFSGTLSSILSASWEKKKLSGEIDPDNPTPVMFAKVAIWALLYGVAAFTPALLISTEVGMTSELIVGLFGIVIVKVAAEGAKKRFKGAPSPEPDSSNS